MGVDNPLALAQDRRCRTLEAVQNTAEEDPHRAYCGDTASKGDKERQIHGIEELAVKTKCIDKRRILPKQPSFELNSVFGRKRNVCQRRTFIAGSG